MYSIYICIYLYIYTCITYIYTYMAGLVTAFSSEFPSGNVASLEIHVWKIVYTKIPLANHVYIGI